MSGATDAHELVFRGVGRAGLEQFLKFALGILDARHPARFADLEAEFAQDDGARGLKAPVQKNRPQQRFERIGQGGRTFAPAGVLLPAAQDQVTAQIQCAPVPGKRAGIDQLGPGLCQRALVGAGRFLVKRLGEDQSQQGVAQEFQPLVVRRGHGIFVGDRGMRERKSQQALIPEMIAETLLEFDKRGHRSSLRHPAFQTRAAAGARATGPGNSG